MKEQLKIYFACSIRGGGDTSSYEEIVRSIKATGAICLSEIFVNDAMRLQGSTLPETEIYARDINWIEESDAIVAEVTNPSLGVGYELAYAEKLGKPVLTMFNSANIKKLSAMVSGNSNFTNETYSSTDDINRLISKFFEDIN